MGTFKKSEGVLRKVLRMSIISGVLMFSPKSSCVRKDPGQARTWELCELLGGTLNSRVG